MKKLYFLIILFVSVSCLTSCVDIEERYSFKADGSCNVIYSFDMSHAVSVLMNLMSDSVTTSPQFNIVKDTSLNFYSALPDSTQHKLKADEMKLAQSSNLNVKMDLPKSIMKVSINHEAKTAADLKYYLENISKISDNSKLTAVAKPNKDLKGFDASQLVAGQDYYNYEITPHKFYRIIDKSKFNAFLKKTQATFVMAKALLIETPYKLILNFTKPVKSIDNSKAVLSADKKTVTLITNMDEVIANPSVMNLKVDF
ncbi:hypothetical protein [Mucilaginibacter sp. KACC 22063]|uniref:hypothetical protein n=1 Tax=Mucilaginibacter sp. KACC 22063 TaxID=3025666 RepID=UPI00236589A4|nr:hypothetical protein [Mucilaginibacter sp. KACC 22063]WDF53459.1 hypothetical protein PQ461_10930 [Mucilaginibacter sp. KACC 22063]